MVRGDRIGVVIVAFQSAATITDCLNGCARGAEVKEVVVVDNSADSLTAKRVKHFARGALCRITYIAAESNQGFAGGCMNGADLLDDVDVVFFVNPDAFLKRTLGELLACVDPQASIVSARLESTDKRGYYNARRLVTPGWELAKVLFGSAVYTRRYIRSSARSKCRELAVGQVDGALLGIDLSDFKNLGGFDRRFELYYEDVDICRRAAELGPIKFITEVWGQHIGGASSTQLPRAPYVALRVSRARYFLKHYSSLPGLRPMIFMITLIESVTRSFTFQSEGRAVRWEAVLLVRRELRNPGIVRVLDGARP